MECGSKRYLKIFNTKFLLFGGGCLAGGIFILQQDKSEILVLTRNPTIQSAIYAFIVVGIFVFITALIGFGGAFCENNKCLIIFIVFVVTIMLGQGIAVVLTFVYKDQFGPFARDNFKTLQQSHYKGPYNTSDIVSVAFDLVHIHFQCCGVDTGAEYANISNWNTSYAYDAGNGSYVVGVATIPATCCEVNDTALFPSDITGFLNSMTNNTCPVTLASSYYSTGCFEAARIKDLLSLFIKVLPIVGIVIGGLELLGIITAGYLIKKDKDKKDKDNKDKGQEGQGQEGQGQEGQGQGQG